MKLRLIALTLLSLIVFSQESESNNIDPFEDINRIVFNISDDLDQAVLRPAAEFYSEYTPLFLKNGITNVFSNLSEVCLLYTSPSPRDLSTSRMPSSA